MKESQHSLSDIDIKKTLKEDVLLREVSNLTKELLDCSEYFKQAFIKIRSDTDVTLNDPIETTLKVGKDSVQPLINLKKVATEVFSSTSENERSSGKIFDETRLDDFEKHLGELKKQGNERRELINLVGSLLEATFELTKQTKNTNESCASSESILSSDPSACEFSLFDNSNINIATSSPLADITNIKQK